MTIDWKIFLNSPPPSEEEPPQVTKNLNFRIFLFIWLSLRPVSRGKAKRGGSWHTFGRKGRAAWSVACVESLIESNSLLSALFFSSEPSQLSLSLSLFRETHVAI